jgi:hypothetical protein
LPSISRAARRAAAHPAFVAVLLVGATVRVLTMIAYPPALFFGDSWDYIVAAFSGHPVAISSNRPSVYGWLIRLFTLPSRDFVQLVGFQHLAGLLTGTLVYVLLLRARIPRTAAAAAAALVILDGYAITLEQYVMAESFFTLTLVVMAALLVWRPRPGPRTTALVGLLLAAATLQRQSGLFVIPVVAIYLLWARTSWRGLLAFALALAVPICAYAARFDQRYGTFALTHTSGWSLYGRIAGFANCAGAGIAPDARFLCETPAQRASHPDASDWYIFDADSPAVQRWGSYGSRSARGVNSDGILAAFARRIILHQPLAYLGSVVSDTLEFFTPGVTAYADSVSATSLPETPAAETVVPVVKRRFLPSLQLQVRSPASVVRAYRGVIHVPRPVLALLALASLAALALRLPARREVFLLSGSGLALIVGVAATAGFGIRYLLPAVPFLALGGTLAARDLAEHALHGGMRTAWRGPRRTSAARAQP